MKVLVLGSTGMLGSMVFNYLNNYSTFETTATSRNNRAKAEYFNVFNFLNEPQNNKFLKKYDYIINCIGIIKPYCKDDDMEGVKTAIEVNSLFPHKLSEFLEDSDAKIIQIATDCVYSGISGKYKENDPHDALDAYGKSKSLGEVQKSNLLNIRCSIIGPEKKSHLSLLDWFLNQPPKADLTGFAHHHWNGITTLQFAQLCRQLIDDNLFKKLIETNYVHHYLPNQTVNKYELLNIFTEVFKKDYRIKRVDNIGDPVDRTLATNYDLLKPQNKILMKTAIESLKKYMDSNE